jgi:hypothetical protein
MKESLSDEVVFYFSATYGPVDPMALVEIVPTTWPPIAIHVIEADNDRNHITLFTTGMSNEPMVVPKGYESFQYAELYIQLPADRPSKIGGQVNAAHLWAVDLMRSIASRPHEKRSWIGGHLAFTKARNTLPPPFTSVLLFARDHFTSEDGRVVQLYHVSLLHTEERHLDSTQGIPKLFSALDRNNVSFVTDLNRKPFLDPLPWHVAFLNALGSILYLFIPILLVLWICIPGMGWASLAAFIGIILTIFAIRVVRSRIEQSGLQDLNSNGLAPHPGPWQDALRTILAQNGGKFERV